MKEFKKKKKEKMPPYDSLLRFSRADIVLTQENNFGLEDTFNWDQAALDLAAVIEETPQEINENPTPAANPLLPHSWTIEQMQTWREHIYQLNQLRAAIGLPLYSRWPTYNGGYQLETYDYFVSGV